MIINKSYESKAKLFKFFYKFNIENHNHNVIYKFIIYYKEKKHLLYNIFRRIKKYISKKILYLKILTFHFGKNHIIIDSYISRNSK